MKCSKCKRVLIEENESQEQIISSKYLSNSKTCIDCLDDNKTENQFFSTKDVKILQSLPLDRKIMKTQTKISEWYMRWENKVYISFSGGSDSTVLAHIAAQVCKSFGYKLILVFCNTGLEYLAIREFAKWFPKYLEEEFEIEVEFKEISPKTQFSKVLTQYGYPVVSKDVSNAVAGAKESTNNTRYQKLCGVYTDKKTGKLSQHNCPQYKYLLDAPFKVSDKCCEKLKKEPFKIYEKETGNKMITAMMADESQKRTRDYKKTGCNAFDLKRPQSQPMGFWLEQDKLTYLQKHNVPYCEVYGDIIEENGKLRFTGEQRTGCLFCLFGATTGENKTLINLKNYPDESKRLHYCMNGGEFNESGYFIPNKEGLGLQFVCDYLGIKN